MTKKKKKLYINCPAIWKADFPSDFSNMNLHFSKKYHCITIQQKRQLQASYNQ